MLPMKRMKQIGLLWIAVAVLAACTNYKEPAQAAIAQAESQMEGIAADAQKYKPEEFKALEDKLAAAKASFDKGDHKEALEAAKTLPAEIDGVSADVAAKKKEVMDEMSAEWTKLSADVPQMVAAIGSRVEVLSKSKKPPKGFEEARTGFESLKTLWSEATAAASAGKYDEAVAKGRTAQANGKEIMGQLGMSS
jgi:hypothetical protein